MIFPHYSYEREARKTVSNPFHPCSITLLPHNLKSLLQPVPILVHQRQYMRAYGRLQRHLVKSTRTAEVNAVEVPEYFDPRRAVRHLENRAAQFAIQIDRHINPGRVFWIN